MASPSTELSMPSGPGSKMSRQTVAIRAIGKTTGMKKNVRNTGMPRSGRLSRSASPRAAAVCTGTMTAANRTLLPSAR
ncbi:hypothetical protein [Nocardiopsis lucentensis]|uniref:hypothetical protein n=1 Tax=Nocardiopsis lucentensis TaxID=53441 RepID=UPI0019D3A931|nr:hypothetical protein [Nocardiopsis lucentensis]